MGGMSLASSKQTPGLNRTTSIGEMPLKKPAERLRVSMKAQRRMTTHFAHDEFIEPGHVAGPAHHDCDSYLMPVCSVCVARWGIQLKMPPRFLTLRQSKVSLSMFLFLRLCS